MRSKLTILLFVAVIIFIVGACHKDEVEKSPNGPTDPTPVTPDLTVKTTSSVSGYVVDESGTPVVYASVSAGDKQATTDAYGYFEITDASLAKVAGQVKITKAGYFDGYKTFVPVENKESFVRFQLLLKSETGTVKASSGGAVTTTDGGKISLPANGIMTANNSTAYAGTVHVNARLISTSDDSSLQLNMPGDARGTDINGYVKTLKSYSTIAVELTGDNSELLQITGSTPATLTLPIPSAISADAPSTIDLWYFDTATGLWKQEGTAVKTGDTYVGTVTHFSFWEAAVGVPLVNFSAHIVDASAQPLAHVAVSINIAGMPKNAGYGKFGYTDANGDITGAVFANANLVLDVLTPCALSAYSLDFATAATDIDLGTITGNLGQNVVTLTGTVTNCSNQPVASGYVQTYDHGFYNRIDVVNGNFTFTGLACTNTIVNIVVVDNATNEQNAPKQVTINPGANNLGALTACGTPTMGNITYTMDSVTTVVIQEPADAIEAIYAGPQIAATQIVTTSGNPNTAQKMAFQIAGGSDTTSVHTVSEIFSTAFPSGRGYWPVPVKVTITEYGAIGGFVAGSFSSYMLDFNDNSLHTISCSFRVRRFQ